MADRIPAHTAGYMELVGPDKDADCRKVEVKGGVASNRGCCNHFEPKTPQVESFHCGECEFRKGKGFAARIGEK